MDAPHIGIENLTIAYGDREVLHKVSLAVPRNSIASVEVA